MTDVSHHAIWVQTVIRNLTYLDKLRYGQDGLVLVAEETPQRPCEPGSPPEDVVNQGELHHGGEHEHGAGQHVDVDGSCVRQSRGKSYVILK